jgi:hypothetical protein
MLDWGVDGFKIESQSSQIYCVVSIYYFTALNCVYFHCYYIKHVMSQGHVGISKN